MATVIELSSLHAFLCTRDKQRAKQFKRMRQIKRCITLLLYCSKWEGRNQDEWYKNKPVGN